MKYFLTLPLVFLIVGCSPKQGSNKPTTPVTVAADLGKNADYFRNLYGLPKSEKQTAEFAFSLPGYGSMMRLARPLIVQEYQSDKLRTAVLYSSPERQAIWVKYILPNPWTQEQINAALGAYGSDWKIVQQNFGVNFIMQERAPVAYGTSTGVLAYKTMVNELIVYAPQLFVDLKGQIEEGERQKKAVPRF